MQKDPALGYKIRVQILTVINLFLWFYVYCSALVIELIASNTGNGSTRSKIYLQKNAQTMEKRSPFDKPKKYH